MFVALGINKGYDFQFVGDEIPRQHRFSVCSNPIACGAYCFGDLLTAPMQRELSLATEFFGPHRWPGRDEETVTMRNRVVRVLHGIELFTLVIPIIAFVFALIGMSIKFVASLWIPPITLLENPDAPFKQENGEILIGSYNVCLMDQFAVNCNNLTESEGRAAGIANTLFRDYMEGRAPDILCLQECFHLRSTEVLCEGANGSIGIRNLYPHIICNVAPNEGINVNSGLCLASMHPIEEAGFRPWTISAGEDWLSNKGLLRVVVRIGDRRVVVYNTHFQAKVGVRYDEIRMEQLTLMRNFIEDDDNSNCSAVFVCGDLNMSPEEAHGTLGPSFHHQNVEGRSVYDQEAMWGRTDWQGARTDERIDHIYVYGQDKGVMGEAEVLDHYCTEISGLSDHLPVTAKFKLSSFDIPGG